MKYHIPIELPSLANSRLHWRRMTSLKRGQRWATHISMKKCRESAAVPALPLVVTITRHGPRKLDDDNLAAACKYVRDQIAEEVGMDDGSPLYTWVYKQVTGPYGVDVEIAPR